MTEGWTDDGPTPERELASIIDCHLGCLVGVTKPKDAEEYLQLSVAEIRKLLAQRLPNATLDDIDDLFDGAIAILMGEVAYPRDLATLALLGAGAVYVEKTADLLQDRLEAQMGL
jgi:hypothetical protein